MKEVRGDLFEAKADAICITTNGVVVPGGRAVMGAGVALQAKQRWPEVEFILGYEIMDKGSKVRKLTSNYGFAKTPMLWHEVAIGGSPDGDGIITPYHIVAFPVKTDWKANASLTLIVRSVAELIELTTAEGWTRVALPRPGCGAGGMTWSGVKPLLADLDDRFVVVDKS